jgi:hypothetical protein
MPLGSYNPNMAILLKCIRKRGSHIAYCVTSNPSYLGRYNSFVTIHGA